MFNNLIFGQVYALTKERDTLRREQSRKSDAAALLKEKDEIIKQVMAEGMLNLIRNHLDNSLLMSTSYYFGLCL